MSLFDLLGFNGSPQGNAPGSGLAQLLGFNTVDPAASGVPGAQAQDAGFFGLAPNDPGNSMKMQMIMNGLRTRSGDAPEMFEGVMEAGQNAQTMQMRQQVADQEAAAREEEKARRQQLSEYAMSVVPANLQSMAQVDPESALRIWDSMQPKSADPTANMQNVEYLVSQGVDRDAAIAQVFGGQGPSTVVNVGDPGGGELRTALDKKEGEVWSGYLTSGAVSGANASDFEVLDELITIAPQGPITGRLAETFKGFSSSGDAFQSIVKRIAPTLRAPGSGATSDIEYDGMLRSLPALSNTPEANVMINEIMKSKAAINVERADVIRQYQTEQIDLNTARQLIGELDSRSIMTPEMQQALSGIGGGGNSNTGQTSSGITWKVD